MKIRTFCRYKYYPS